MLIIIKLQKVEQYSLIPSRNKWSIQTCIIGKSRGMISIVATDAVTSGVDAVMKSSMDKIFLQVI